MGSYYLSFFKIKVLNFLFFLSVLLKNILCTINYIHSTHGSVSFDSCKLSWNHQKMVEQFITSTRFLILFCIPLLPLSSAPNILCFGFITTDLFAFYINVIIQYILFCVIHEEIFLNIMMYKYQLDQCGSVLQSLYLCNFLVGFLEVVQIGV